MNLDGFRTFVSKEIGLDNNPSTEQPQIDASVNTAVIKVLEDTECYVREDVFTGFDGSSTDYSFDSGILEIVDCFFTEGSTNYRLERITINELIEHKRLSIPAQSPTCYMAVNGDNMLQFWPAPDSGASMTIYYVPVPTSLVNGSDDPSNASYGGVPTYFHDAIKWWACFEAASYDDDATSAQGQRYQQLYVAEIARARRHMRKRGGNRNQRAVVNEVRKRRPYHDNSIYPRY